MSSAEGSAAVGGAGSPAVASRRDAGALLMPPPAPRAPRRAGPVVLDEDEYVARLDAIITREYFPDVPKLRDTLRWLQLALLPQQLTVQWPRPVLPQLDHRLRPSTWGTAQVVAFTQPDAAICTTGI